MGPGRMSSTRKPLGFERSVPTVHMHTSLMAKKILEHIDRSIPTPKEKSAELKLATKWKNPESSVN
ncbi:nucleoporin-like protein, partial [Trifolium medium]|nr:nucleoporin-like protein [Trifolium medium]